MTILFRGHDRVDMQHSYIVHQIRARRGACVVSPGLPEEPDTINGQIMMNNYILFGKPIDCRASHIGDAPRVQRNPK